MKVMMTGKSEKCDDFTNKLALDVENMLEKYEYDELTINKANKGWLEVQFFVKKAGE